MDTGEDQELVVQQLADGSLITPDGQRIVISKDGMSLEANDGSEEIAEEGVEYMDAEEIIAADETNGQMLASDVQEETQELPSEVLGEGVAIAENDLKAIVGVETGMPVLEEVADVSGSQRGESVPPPDLVPENNANSVKENGEVDDIPELIDDSTSQQLAQEIEHSVDIMNEKDMYSTGTSTEPNATMVDITDEQPTDATDQASVIDSAMMTENGDMESDANGKAIDSDENAGDDIEQDDLEAPPVLTKETVAASAPALPKKVVNETPRRGRRTKVVAESNDPPVIEPEHSQKKNATPSPKKKDAKSLGSSALSSPRRGRAAKIEPEKEKANDTLDANNKPSGRRKRQADGEKSNKGAAADNYEDDIQRVFTIKKGRGRPKRSENIQQSVGDDNAELEDVVAEAITTPRRRGRPTRAKNEKGGGDEVEWHAVNRGSKASAVDKATSKRQAAKGTVQEIDDEGEFSISITPSPKKRNTRGRVAAMQDTSGTSQDRSAKLEAEIDANERQVLLERQSTFEFDEDLYESFSTPVKGTKRKTESIVSADTGLDSSEKLATTSHDEGPGYVTRKRARVSFAESVQLQEVTEKKIASVENVVVSSSPLKITENSAPVQSSKLTKVDTNEQPSQACDIYSIDMIDDDRLTSDKAQHKQQHGEFSTPQKAAESMSDFQSPDDGVKPTMVTFDGTQTPLLPTLPPPPFVEVEIVGEWEGRRSVQTQTDPRLKKKKFAPLGQEDIAVKDDPEDFANEYRKRKKKGELGLFDDAEIRRRKRSAEEALKCPFCDKAFVLLVKHIKAKHRHEPDYEEEMRNARWRERIMKVSATGCNEEGDQCQQCGRITKHMKRHLESHQVNRLQIPCPICQKVVLKTGMSSHMRTVHSGRRPYQCPHCDYSSAFRGNLNTHIKGMHLHSRQYLCSVCNSAFKTLGALIGHTKRVHEGWKSPNQKIFICSVCEKRFTKKYHVDRHMLIHTGEKPHKCGDCGRTFNNKSNLMSHIQLVHKKLSPYQCDLCKETFKRKKQLLEHIGKVHVSQGEHVVFKTPMEEMQEYEEYYEEEDGINPGIIIRRAAPDEDDEEEMEEGDLTTVQQVDAAAFYAANPGMQMATVVDSETAQALSEGQTITTLQTEGGAETIIIVHAPDQGELAYLEEQQVNEEITVRIDATGEIVSDVAEMVVN